MVEKMVGRMEPWKHWVQKMDIPRGTSWERPMVVSRVVELVVSMVRGLVFELVVVEEVEVKTIDAICSPCFHVPYCLASFPDPCFVPSHHHLPCFDLPSFLVFFVFLPEQE